MGSAEQIEADFERRDDTFAGALTAGRPVVLWFEHDLYDQLQLLEVLSLVDRPEGVELIVVGWFPGRPGFRGLAELPDAAGLSLSERPGAGGARRRPSDARPAVRGDADREEAPFAGDAWVWMQAAGLEGLVTAVDASARIGLIDAGRRVLDGTADRVELLGLDRWVGGIHLRPDRLVRR